jgi:pyruvate dehydrogenase E2 component (dihydrolipoamide acetyltransferase)
MATPLVMPKLGLTMTEGTVVRWLKQDGQPVEKGEPIAVVMSKKISFEVKAPGSGILRHAARLKQTKPVGAPFAYITQPGEEVPVEAIYPPAVEAAPGTAPAPASEGVAEKKAFVLASPAARRLAKEKGVELSLVQGTGSEGRVVEADIYRFLEEQVAKEAAPAAEPEPLATPSAKWLARERGVDLSQVPGSGLGGRITEQDVEAFLASQPTAAPIGILPFSGMRRAIAEHMLDSLHQTAQVTVTSEADVTDLVKLRSQLKAEFDLSYTDLIVKAVAKALKQHPRLNSTLIGDEIHLLSEINIGVAVALEDGVIVPVVRDANRKEVPEIAEETRRLVQGAREGTLSVDEVTGSTFTVTNLGAYGAHYFTPILNSPEVAILGVGRIVEKPAIYEGQIARRSYMALSLTFDHRLVDGAPAAQFLQTVVEILENPYRILVG